jgi:PAS domain S-box-containing protein
MSVDTGRERIDGGRPRQRVVDRLTPVAQPGQAGESPVFCPSQESADHSKPMERNEPGGLEVQAEGGTQGRTPLPVWLRRLGDYGLALLFVAAAALLRWALPEVLRPAPFLVFYLAWVAAAVFGGLGPGLLATLLSWLCIDSFFDPTPGRIDFMGLDSISRLLVFLGGGLVVSVVGEKIRRSRVRVRQQGRELAAMNTALRVSEEKYRFLVENSKDITGTIDLSGQPTFVSANVEKMTGYRPDELIGKTIWDFLAPECHDLVRENLRRRLRGEDVPPYELLAVGKDGRRVPFEMVMASIVDDRGNIVGVQGVSREITERKRTEETLRASEAKYRFLVENSKDITWTIDLRGRLMFVSGNAEKVIGYRANELLGQPMWSLLAPECHDLIKEKLGRRLRGEDVPPYELLVVGKDGRRIPFEVVTASIVDDGGNVVGAQGVSREITERKRAEEALRESEFHLAQAQQITHLGSWSWDFAEDRLFWSDETYRLYGLQPGESVPRHEDFLNFVHPEDRPRVEQCVQEALAHGGSYRLDFRIVQKGGQERYVYCEAQVVLDREGHPVKAEGALQDITERKQAEDALAESRKRYRGLVEKINDWVWEVDADGVYTYVSPRALELLGYAPEEIVGKTPFDFMPPAEAERVWNAFEPVWLGRKPLELLENTLVRKDGRLVTVETSGMPVFAEDGTFLGYMGIDRDVTERKQAEEALRESEERYRTLFESSRDGIIFTDMEGRILHANPYYREMLGYSEEELHALTYQQLTPRRWQETEAAIVRDKIMSRGYSGVYEKEYIRKDGTVFPISIQVWLVRDAHGQPQGMWGIVRDITDRRRAEQALRKSEEKFAKAFRSSPIAIAVTRLRDGRILDANEAMLKLLHFTADEVIGHTTRDLDIWVDVNDRAQFTQMLATAGSVRDLEYRLRTKDGAIVRIHLSAEVLEFGGEPCLLATLVDVTERERAAEALRREKTFTDKLLNAPRDTVFLFEPATGKPIRWNQRLVEVSGYSDEEIAGMKAPDDFFDEQDLQKARESIAKISAAGQDVLELSLVTKRGVPIPFEYVATVVETEDGKTLFLSIGRDITERKRAEEALRESEARFRIMADGSPNPIWVTNAAGERIFANKQYLEYFGISEREMEGGEWKLFLHPDDAPTYVHSFMSSLKEHRPFSAEARVRRTDGQWRWIESHAEPRLSLEGEFLGFVGITQDITERKQAEQDLRELNATLESRVAQRTAELEDRARQLQKLTLELTEAEERERQRLAEILHDNLQQVLAAAKFQMGLLDGRVRNDVESQEIMEQAKGLLVDAIAQSRSLSHELSAPALSRTDLGEAFEWLAEQMQKKHGLRVHLEIRDPIEVASEPLRVLLYKAAQELLFNAVKHAGVHEARLRLRRKRGRLWLSVADEGRGFDPTEPGHTLGFGLLSIRERVGYLGGRLKMASSPGRGSIFLIAVPAAEVGEER